MSELIITAGGITSAIRLSKKLEESGIINPKVIHTPPAVSSGGCSYSVKISEYFLAAVKKLSSEKRIKFKKIYLENIVNGERVYSAVS